MRCCVLGPLELRSVGGAPVTVPEARVRALLVALVIREGAPVRPDRLVDELWGASLPADPARVLRAKVSRLRGVLDQAEPGGRERLVHSGAGYRLVLADGGTDTAVFRAAVRRAGATADPAVRAAELTDALELWRGPALAGFQDEPFAAPAAARLEEERLTALEDRAEARLALGQARAVVDELGALVRDHPLRERLRAAQMLALYHCGRQAAALETFERLRAQLAEELGTDPGPAVAALHQRILRQEVTAGPAVPERDGEAREVAPPAPVPPVRTNLPASVDTFTGREREIGEVRASLLGSTRLVTLTGPGGVGKTRLALEIAGELAEEGPFDAVWLTELGPVPHGGDDTLARVTEAVGTVLAVRDSAAPHLTPGTAARQLGTALRAARTLLVLDNCEHLVDPVANLTRELLRTVRGLCVLATSREPLAIPGERVYAVPLLDTPEAEGGAHPARRTDAVRLFVDRAAAAAPGFVMDERTAPLVGAVCRRLDGLPLALELAAHRVRTLGLDGLVERLDDRFGVLTATTRGMPRRQRTLWGVIDWSWDLLGPEERAVLRRMSVHTDGCTVEAVEAVTGTADLPGGVLEPLGRLVEQSLVTAVEGPLGTRYRLLESVAAYAAERLAESGEADETTHRHLTYYAGFAERVDPLLRGPEQHHWLDRMAQENANLRAAFFAAVERRDGRLALRLAVAPLWYRWLRGRYGEARRLVSAALEVPGAEPAHRAVATAWQAGLALLDGARDPVADRSEPRPPGAASATVAELDGAVPGVAAASRAFDTLSALPPTTDGATEAARTRAVWFLGAALAESGAVAAAAPPVHGALAAARRQGDRWGTAAALVALGWLEGISATGQGADSPAEEALRLFRELGDRWGQLQAMAALVDDLGTRGAGREAARLAREALGVAEELGLRAEISFWRSRTGEAALEEGDVRTAEGLFRQARAEALAAGYPFGLRLAELNLAVAALAERDLDTAERRLTDWLRDHAGTVPMDTSMALTLAGWTAWHRGDATTAWRRQLDGLRSARATSVAWPALLAGEGLAAAAATVGESEVAARLLGALDDAPRVAWLGNRAITDADRRWTAERARAALGDPGFTAARAAGRRAGWEAVTDGVLRSAAAVPAPTAESPTEAGAERT